MNECLECYGTGVLIPRGDKKHTVECPHCNGSGKEGDEK